MGNGIETSDTWYVMALTSKLNISDKFIFLMYTNTICIYVGTGMLNLPSIEIENIL